MKLILSAIKSLLRKNDLEHSELRKEIENIPQANWNQNDKNAPDYIKNRTHYTEDRVISQGVITTDYVEELDDYQYLPSATYEIGKTYTVIINNKTYKYMFEQRYSGAWGGYMYGFNLNGDIVMFMAHFGVELNGNLVTTKLRFDCAPDVFPLDIKVIDTVDEPLDYKYIPYGFLRYDEVQSLTKEEKANAIETFRGVFPQPFCIITFNESNGKYTCSRTFSEVRKLMDSGTLVVGKVSGLRTIYLPEYMSAGTVYNFYYDEFNSSSHYRKILSLKQDNTVDYKIIQLKDVKVEDVKNNYLTLKSSTPESSKIFRITIGDDGVLSAEEITL